MFHTVWLDDWFANWGSTAKHWQAHQYWWCVHDTAPTSPWFEPCAMATISAPSMNIVSTRLSTGGTLLYFSWQEWMMMRWGMLNVHYLLIQTSSTCQCVFLSRPWSYCTRLKILQQQDFQYRMRPKVSGNGKWHTRTYTHTTGLHGCTACIIINHALTQTCSCTLADPCDG